MVYLPTFTLNVGEYTIVWVCGSTRSSVSVFGQDGIINANGATVASAMMCLGRLQTIHPPGGWEFSPTWWWFSKGSVPQKMHRKLQFEEGREIFRRRSGGCLFGDIEMLSKCIDVKWTGFYSKFILYIDIHGHLISCVHPVWLYVDFHEDCINYNIAIHQEYNHIPYHPWYICLHLPEKSTKSR